jgi:hypothetical protein
MYMVKGVAEIAEDYALLQKGQDGIMQIDSDTFKDLSGRCVFEFGSQPEDFDLEHFKEWSVQFEVGFKDSLNMVYAIIDTITGADGEPVEQRVYRKDGKIDGVSVSPSQRKVRIRGKECPIKHEEMPTAYRSAKTTLRKALELDIQLLDAEGYPRGKTELTNEIKEAASNKTAMEKFLGTIGTASKIANDLEVTDINQALVLVDTLRKQVADLSMSGGADED